MTWESCSFQKQNHWSISLYHREILPWKQPWPRKNVKKNDTVYVWTCSSSEFIAYCPCYLKYTPPCEYNKNLILPSKCHLKQQINISDIKSLPVKQLRKFMQYMFETTHKEIQAKVKTCVSINMKGTTSSGIFQLWRGCGFTFWNITIDSSYRDSHDLHLGKCRQRCKWQKC